MNRIVLIFGDPDSGKSWLANELHDRYGYNVLSVDELYIQFIKEDYPKLYLESLNLVVSQHYKQVLKATEKDGEKRWREYVVSFIKENFNHTSLLAVEGYLLLPVLKYVRSKLSQRGTRVAVVYVHDRKYYSDSDIEGIHIG